MHNIYLQILSRYNNVNNVLEYIEAEGHAEYVLSAEPHTLNKIASKFAIDKIDKKKGKKKIAAVKKSTIEILKSQTVKQYCKFILTNQPIENNQKPSAISELKFFLKTNTSSSSINTFNINNLIQSANSIHFIDYIFSCVILYYSPDILNE